jgi:predicted metal-binding membrane protein
MDTGRLLLMLRLARPVRRLGFCPACRLDVSGTAAARGVQMAATGVTVAVVLAVAGAAWAFTAWQMLSPGMAMGLGPISSFAATWMVMMAAMMLPSAIPLVYRFAQRAEGRRARPAALAVLALVYLAVWLAFGVGCYFAYNALGMSARNRALAA